jgi:hypothetical protein
MMIIGAHTIINSTNAEADRAFLKDVLQWTTLPGGGKLGVYQPRHERPEPPPRG